MRKKITIILLLMVLFGIVGAQETNEQVAFRFVAGNDMFFSPWSGNGENLERLTTFINAHKERFVSGADPIRVNGYCAGVGDATERLQRAKTMSNRVKSELITRCGLSEENFLTLNSIAAYEGEKNIVVVSITLPTPKARHAVDQPTVRPMEQPIQQPMQQAHEEARPADKAPEQQTGEPEAILLPLVAKTDKLAGLHLRTNLLYWVALTPNIGIEWRIHPAYGIKVDGGYSHWSYSGKDKIQKLWFINPEVRRYMLENKRLYMGIGATLGAYNLKFGSTGYQGNIYGGSITAGYQLPVGKQFSLDFNLGLGAAHLSYDTFSVLDGVRVYKEKACRKTRFAPTQIGISLIWHIGHSPVKQ